MKKNFKLESNTYKKIVKLIKKYNFSEFDLISNYGLFSGDTNLFKTLTIYNLIKQTEKVNGDIIEFGIWRGNTSLLIKKILEIYRINKKVFMFDHFRGLRHFQRKDGNKAKFLKGSYLGNKKPIKELINFFKFKNIYFIDKDATKLNNNFFGKQKFSMAIIDVDLYEPTKKILEALKKNISKNGIIIFDEGRSKLFPGEGLALKEFLKNNKSTFKLKNIEYSRQPDIYIKKIK